MKTAEDYFKERFSEIYHSDKNEKKAQRFDFYDITDFADQYADLVSASKEARIKELTEALTNAKEVLQWHLDKSIPFQSVDQSDFFNNTANAIEQSESALNPPTDGSSNSPS